VKTCPRCEFAWAERTSAYDPRMPPRFELCLTLAGSRGCQKLGHPVPESNISSQEKSGSPDTMST